MTRICSGDDFSEVTMHIPHICCAYFCAFFLPSLQMYISLSEATATKQCKARQLSRNYILRETITILTRLQYEAKRTRITNVKCVSEGDTESVRTKTVNVLQMVTGETTFKCMIFSLGQRWFLSFIVISSSYWRHPCLRLAVVWAFDMTFE